MPVLKVLAKVLKQACNKLIAECKCDGTPCISDVCTHTLLLRMQAVAAAAGGSLQAGLQHRAMQHSMMGAGAQVPAASSSGEIIPGTGDFNLI